MSNLQETALPREAKKPTYFDALKIWNSTQPKRTVPKKGSDSYNEVMIIFNDLKEKAIAPFEKPEPVIEEIESEIPAVIKVKKPRKPRVKKAETVIEEKESEPEVPAKKPRKPRVKKAEPEVDARSEVKV